MFANNNTISILGNAATAVANATSLADGAATTLETFLDELMSCTETDCDVYFNIHTNYSFATNTGALGLVRGQLKKYACPTPFRQNVYNLCFGATVNSENTNKVVPNPLAKDAGSMLPVTLDIIVVYTPEPTNTVDMPGEVVVYTPEEGNWKEAEEDSASWTMSASLSAALAVVLGTVTLLLL